MNEPSSNFGLKELRQAMDAVREAGKVRVPIAELESICERAKAQGWAIVTRNQKFVFVHSSLNRSVIGEPNDDKKIALASACWKLKHSGWLNE